MPPAYHHGDLKNALIRSGLELLASEGRQALSLRKVAHRAGVSEAAPYRHFQNKEALLAAIAEQGFLQLAERLQAVAETHTDNAQSLFFQTGQAYIEFAFHNPDAMRVMFGQGSLGGLDSFKGLKEASDEALGYLVDVVEFCQLEGLAKEEHPLPLALAFWSVLHGLSMLSIDRFVRDHLEEDSHSRSLSQNTLEIFLKGLKNEA